MRAGAPALSRIFIFRNQALRFFQAPALQTPSPARLWAFGFAFWLLLISGFVGTPGIQQAIRLKSLLETKQAQLKIVQEDLRKLQLEAQDLEHNRITQQREIRRVLGYAAPDEIIFDFSAGERI